MAQTDELLESELLRRLNEYRISGVDGAAKELCIAAASTIRRLREIVGKLPYPADRVARKVHDALCEGAENE